MKEKLIELSKKIMELNCSYLRSEIEVKINERAKTAVNASKVFDMMYNERIINEAKGWFYLNGSTPF
jgi:hypothetical protein